MTDIKLYVCATCIDRLDTHLGVLLQWLFPLAGRSLDINAEGFLGIVCFKKCCQAWEPLE